MIVRNFHELRNSDRSVSDANWNSVRMLLADDGMGFSFHITTIASGTVHEFHYKHHFESVYCIRGRGKITALETGETWEIKPGVMYALDKHDRHRLEVEEEAEFACCFNPPVTGTEVHRADGSYAPAEEA